MRIKILTLAIFIILLTGCESGDNELGAQPEYVTAPENNTYKIGEKNFQEEFKNDITSDDPLQYKLDDKYIAFKPVSMKWDNEGSSFKDTASVSKTTGKKEYKNVLGNGIDLEMKTDSRVWSKIVKIESLDKLGSIPKDAEYLEIEYVMKTNFVIDGWDKDSEMEITDKVRLGDYSYLEPAMVWDSYSEKVCEETCNPEDETECNNECDILYHREQIKSFIQKDKFIKQIPVEFLKTATYPVYTDADITYGTAEEFEAGVTEFISVEGVNSSSNKFVVCFVDESDADAGKCRAGTVSGTNITWGSTVEFVADATPFFEEGQTMTDVCKTDTDEFVIAFSSATDGDDGYVYSASTTAGTTINLGVKFEFNNANTEDVQCVPTDTDQFAVAYRDETGGLDGYTEACTVAADSSISCGTRAEYCNGSIGMPPMAKLDTDKYIICGSCGEDGNMDGECVALSVGASDALTEGTMKNYYDWDDGGSFSGNFSVNAPTTDSFLLTYKDDNNTQGESLIGTTTGETINSYGDGTPVDFSNTSDVAFARSVAIDATHSVIVYSDVGDGEAGKSNYMTIDFSTGTITASTPEEFESGATGGSYHGLDVALIGSDKIVVCYQDDGDSDKGKCIVGDSPSEAPAAVDTTQPPEIIIYD